MRKFLEKSHGHPNIHELAEEYTEDTSGLIQMIEEIHAVVEDRNFKSRLTRIKNKLRKKSSASESDVSIADES